MADEKTCSVKQNCGGCGECDWEFNAQVHRPGTVNPQLAVIREDGATIMLPITNKKADELMKLGMSSGS